MTEKEYLLLKKYDKLVFKNSGQEIEFIRHVEGAERGLVMYLEPYGEKGYLREKLSEFHHSHFFGPFAVIEKVNAKNL